MNQVLQALIRRRRRRVFKKMEIPKKILRKLIKRKRVRNQINFAI
jgi:hypothetical protein